MRTITELSQKWWYRLIKGLFILGFVFIFLIWNFFLNEGIKKVDYYKSVITCNTKSKNVSTINDVVGFADLEKLKDGFNYKKFYTDKGNSYLVKTIVSFCTTSNIDNRSLDELQRTKNYLIENPNLTAEEFRKKIDIDNEKDPLGVFISYDNHIFDIKPVYSYQPIETTLVGDFVLILVFLILRGFFYYVAIGKINPK